MQQKLLCLSLTLTVGGWFATANAQDVRIKGSSTPKPFVLIQEPPQAKLVGKNNTVSFYQLPQDRMICIVPNEKNLDPMNVWQHNDSTRIQQNIPNRIPRRKIIPDPTKSFAPSTSFNIFRFKEGGASPYGN